MSSTRSSESAFRSSWKEASIVTCSGSQPSRSTTMFLKSSKLSFWVSNLASNANARWGGAVTYCTSPTSGWDCELQAGRRSPHRHRILAGGELFHHPGQRALGPDLDERVAAHFYQRAHTCG